MTAMHKAHSFLEQIQDNGWRLLVSSNGTLLLSAPAWVSSEQWQKARNSIRPYDAEIIDIITGKIDATSKVEKPKKDDLSVNIRLALKQGTISDDFTGFFEFEPCLVSWDVEAFILERTKWDRREALLKQAKVDALRLREVDTIDRKAS